MTLLAKAYPAWSRAVLANQPGWLTAAITVRPKSTIPPIGQMNQIHHRLDIVHNQIHHRLDTMHNQIHHRLDTAQSVSTARIETLMLENSRRFEENSRRFDLLLVEMSSRLDKSATLLVAAWGAVITVVLAGFGFLHQQMDRKIDQTDRKIDQTDRKIDSLKEEMDRKIDAGNAQLKVDLVKALKWNLPFLGCGEEPKLVAVDSEKSGEVTGANPKMVAIDSEKSGEVTGANPKLVAIDSEKSGEVTGAASQN